jgi:hypothetical protein
MVFNHLFIFFHGKENEPKETARVPLSPARRRADRRARKLASLKQVRTLIPPAASMPDARQRGSCPASDRGMKPQSMVLLLIRVRITPEFY